MKDGWLEEFLRGRRVAVLAIPRVGRSPLTTPVWYDYDGARFRVQVEKTSAKAKAVRGGERAPRLTHDSERGASVPLRRRPWAGDVAGERPARNASSSRAALLWPSDLRGSDRDALTAHSSVPFISPTRSRRRFHGVDGSPGGRSRSARC